MADRYDRRRVLFLAQGSATVLAATLAALAFADRADEWVVIGFSLALGVVTAFAAPAQAALVPSLVPARDLGSAVALNSMTFNLARALGPALAALVVVTLGIPAAFAVNSLSYLALVVGLLLVRPRPQQRAESPRLRDSFRLLRAEPKLAASLAIVAAVGWASDPINTLAPAFAETFGRSDTVAGLIIGVFGAGAVIAALAVAGREPASARVVAGSLLLLGGGVALFALSPSFGLALAFLVPAGFGYLAANTAATTRLQLGVAESERGRIMALWTVAFLGLRPLASLLDGALASTFGVRAAGVVLVLPVLLGAVAILVGRRLR